MSRLLSRLALVLSLGLATSIALAWSLAAWLPHTHLSKRFNLIGEPGVNPLGNTIPPIRGQFITVFEFSRPGMVRRAWRPGYVPGSGAPALWTILSPDATLALHLKTANHDRSWGDLPAALAHPTPTSTGAEDARGWPFLCLWCSLNEPAIEAAITAPPIRGGIPLSRITLKSTAAHFRALPFRPIWRGLAADTAIFAAAWSLAIPAFHLARAARRRRRGLCSACAYDLKRDLASGCSECGWNRATAAP